MFERMKTHCFGRFLVDLPLETVLQGERDDYQGRRIDSEEMGWPDFQKLIEERRLQWKTKSYEVENSTLDKEIQIDKYGIIFAGHLEAFGSTSYSMDTFKWDKMRVFRTSGGAYGSDDIETLLEKFSAYVRSVRYRFPHEIPAEQGFCIKDGFIADNGDTGIYESTDAIFRLKDHPDVKIELHGALYFRETPSLLERQKNARLDERFPGQIKRVREGKTMINAMPGEESLTYYPSDDKTGIAQNFVWETQGELKNPRKPYIRLGITTGDASPGITGVSSLETRDVLRLYEAIVKTIRLRPTQEAAPAAAQ
jgi:hypothetical protein